MSKKLAAVIITVHNEIPDEYEKIAIDQCFKVLGSHPIVFIARVDFNFSYYKENYAPQGNVSFEKFSYGPGSKGIDDLMLSSEFYKRFLDYKYILIYHTDAFVFRDDLHYWCSQNYDYIGATIFDTDFTRIFFQYSKYKYFLKLGLLKNKNIGNGGFSLRKVHSFYVSSRLYKPLIKSLTHGLNEDLFWSFKMPYLNPFFRVPSLDKAKSFAFETKPREVFEINGHRLPFGCHAWRRYDYNFWKPFIEEQGYVLS